MFGVLEGELLYSTGPRWALRGLLDRFGVDLGVFGEGFGRVLGGLLGASFACCGLLWLALAALAACAFRSIATQVRSRRPVSAITNPDKVTVASMSQG